MKNLFKEAIIVLAAVLVCGCSQYKYESVKGDPTGTRIYTLDNGLKVYMSVNKDQPRIDAQVAVKVGGKNDPRETTGLAHYFEHLMFKGTQSFGTQNYELEKPMLDRIEELFEVYRKTEDPEQRKAIYHEIDSISYEASKIAIPNEYDKLMASIGASGTNAYTSYDVTCYVENIPSNQIENWARIQADRFENVVLRGFHTELETIYEEYNMYAAMDQQKATEAMMDGLFEHHPYKIDVIGLPSHLKNPSITNVKNYHDQWYVPNNMAVVMSGDFDPDEAIKIVDKYFGALKPNENLVKPVFEPEAPIKAPIVKDVRGNESPNVAIAWRFGGANSKEAIMLDLISSILYNGKAGLFDVDINQPQKTLGTYAYNEALADYSAFVLEGEPKEGQSLDEVADLMLAGIERLKAGDFTEDLLQGIVNNMKYRFMLQMERGGNVARQLVNSFIEDVPWSDVVNYVDRLSAITKDQIVAFANENFKDNYVRVNKLQEKDPTDTRIAKPAITPIFTNRDTASRFLRDMQASASQVKPIEPVFVNFSKELGFTQAKEGVDVIYKKNETNGTFNLSYIFKTGTFSDKVLPIACSYFDYLGTDDMTLAQINEAFYQIACSYGINCGEKYTYVNLSGLAENMPKAMELLEGIIAGLKADPEALAALKQNMIQERRNAKMDQRSNFSRLQSYAIYGRTNPSNNVLSNEELLALTDEELIARIQGLFSFKHEVSYYGPMSQNDFVAMLNREHRTAEELAEFPAAEPYRYKVTEENNVLLAQYDANQLQLFSISNDGENFDLQRVPVIRLYNSYFGSGMNAIVFQEMREARGLAYSASASYSVPSYPEDNVIFRDMIYTQNDKMMDALNAFDEIINNMPVSENAFTIAKESILTNLRTKRIVKNSIISSYLNFREFGLDSTFDRDIFEKVQNYTLDDVVKFQQESVKDRKFTYSILGRIEDLDLKSLEKYGAIRTVSSEELFGY